VRILVALTVGAVLVADANAARPPTPRERAQIVLAVSSRDTTPVVVIRVGTIVVSTEPPGPGAPFTRFALAVAGRRTALLAFYPTSKDWFVQSYGSRRDACRLHPSRFGGRRAAILRDLGIRCP
jgi:hypothetical protein